MVLVYEVLLYLVFALTLPFFLLTGLFRGKYLANFPERMGLYRTEARQHDLWIHAVSVGEAVAAGPVVREILRQRPGTSIVFTTTTITGQAQARRLFPDATIAYFPFDFSFAVKRFLDHHRPRVFATMETEIWPNVTRLCRRGGMKLILANGRISDRSFPRYRAFRFIVGGILKQYSKILAREETDRERFVAIGAAEAAVETTGNVKFDVDAPEGALAIAERLESMLAGRKVIVLGSTAEGEDEEILPHLGKFLTEKNAFAILAPRKAERFPIVAALLRSTSIPFVRRTEIETACSPVDLLLLDSFGELAKIYRYATVAFVGGSLVRTGGHNPIEAAAAGAPVCFGPFMSNFREIASVFLHNYAAEQVSSPAELLAFAGRMFDDATAQRGYAGRGLATVTRNRGAAARTAREIVSLLA
ncbi:MAG TPA: 3-deoxy-D-manno-octulosonic acid transferase [Thermoanaerobaculia bacterium]|nr:3-deoxy-D-manno-octulosonic acid transferase [Thermoanaerobaculia bacterium]